MMAILHVCACTWVCVCVYIYIHTCTYGSSTLHVIFLSPWFFLRQREPHSSVFLTFLNAHTVWAQADKEWEHSRETSSWMSKGFEHQGKKRSSFDVIDSDPRKLWSDAN